MQWKLDHWLTSSVWEQTVWYLSTVTAMTSKSRGGPPPLIPPNPCLIPPQPPLPPPPSPMPTASLTVKGQIGEYKLEVNSQEGLAQLVQVVEKFADIGSQMTMAAHLRYQTQLQNEQMMRFQCMNVPLAITSMFPPVLVPQGTKHLNLLVSQDLSTTYAFPELLFVCMNTGESSTQVNTAQCRG